MTLTQDSQNTCSLLMELSNVPVFVKKQNQDPNIAQNHTTHFCHGEGPWDSRNARTEKITFGADKKYMDTNDTPLFSKIPF